MSTVSSGCHCTREEPARRRPVARRPRPCRRPSAPPATSPDPSRRTRWWWKHDAAHGGADRLAQQRAGVDVDRVHDVRVRLGHVLLEVAAERDVDQLPAAADREQRHAASQRPAGHGQVERVLLVVHVVDLVAADLLAVQRRRDVAAAGEQDAVGETEPPLDLGLGDHAPGRPGMHGQRLAAGAQHALGQRAGGAERPVAVGRGRGGEPGRDRDEGTGGHALTPPGLTNNVCIRTIVRMPAPTPASAARPVPHPAAEANADGHRERRRSRGRHPALDRRRARRRRVDLRRRLAARRPGDRPGQPRRGGRGGRRGGGRERGLPGLGRHAAGRAGRDPAPRRRRRREADRGPGPGRDPRQRLAAALAPARGHAAGGDERAVLRRPPARPCPTRTSTPAATATTSPGTRPGSRRSSRRGTRR